MGIVEFLVENDSLFTRYRVITREVVKIEWVPSQNTEYCGFFEDRKKIAGLESSNS